ncbi:MAG TPA: ABC transporter permease [Bryobacteraceae bacterium]|nr:ABC transporter permease [Bryobacteraceae bacterium]
MTWLWELLRRLQFRLNGERFDQDLAEEMRLHKDLRIADRMADGMPLHDAEAEAQRQFGNTALLHEISRETWGWTFADRLRQDVRYAVRNLIHHPAFTATAVLSLVLGIGANTAIFSIVNAVMLRSLPVEDPEQLVQLRLGLAGDDELNTPLWEQIRDNQKIFSGVLAYSQTRFNLADAGEAQAVNGLFVSGDFFRVLGVPPMLGRALTPADDRSGGGAEGLVAVVSYRFWRNRLNSDPAAAGRTIRLNRRTYVIVGVTPSWFTGLDVERAYDVAVPISAALKAGSTNQDERHHWWLRIMGRLSPGDTLALATDRLQAASPEWLRAALPPASNPPRLVLTPAGQGFSQARVQYRTALFALMGIAALVLLIACANIANLLSARGAARQRELSVRMAIGASRVRVVRQLMTESLLLAAMGAVGGCVLAIWGSRMLLWLLSTASNPIDVAITPDWRLLAFTTAAALITAVLFGLAPSLRSTRLGLSTVLKESQRGTVRGFTRLASARVLVSGQIALSLTLLVCAGLFATTLRNLLTLDPGFDRRGVTLMTVDLPEETTAEQRTQTFQELLAHVKATPGVVSAAHSVLTPIAPSGWAQPTHPEGFVPKSPRDTVLFLNRVSAGYFKTMRTPILIGREFSERDTLTSAPVMVINEFAASTFFGAANPIGKTIALDGMGDGSGREVYQVVGVVRNTKYNRLNEQQRRIGYLAGAQDRAPGTSLRFAILSRVPTESLIGSLRRVVAGVSRDASIEFRSFESQVTESLLQPRLVAALSSVFGGLALVLAMVGLYGTTMYSVTQRRAEIGVRIAMGAQRSSVLWLMMSDVLLLLAAGMIAGALASLGLGRVVASLLFGVRFDDPELLALAALLLICCSAVAALIPAFKGARMDPMSALREE